MPLSITIDETHSKFAAVMALLNGASGGAIAAASPGMSAIPPLPAMTPGAGDDGDDGGPVNANVPTVDSTGLPWDERIHASTKTVKSDGTWTGKRGGPKGSELAAIEAQLRANVAQHAPMPIVQPAPMAIPPVAMPQPMPMPQPAPIAMPSPEPAPVAVAPAAIVAAVAQATGTLDFAQFMQHLSSQMSKRDVNGAPLVHADYLAGITAEISNAFEPHGFAALTAITDIANNPQMISYASQLMQRDGRW